MGIHNKITRDKYYEMKALLKSPKDDEKVIRQFRISQTTVRFIRNSPSYEFYADWVGGKIHKTPRNKDSRYFATTEILHGDVPHGSSASSQEPKTRTNRTITTLMFLVIIFGILWAVGLITYAVLKSN